MTYFLDTNIISGITKNEKSILDSLENAISSDDELLIPIVSWYEIKRGLLSIGSKKIAMLDELSSEMNIALMGFKIFEIAAEIYSNLKKKGKLIEDADIFIAASAIENNAYLVTKNVKHFSRIDGLKVFEIQK